MLQIQLSQIIVSFSNSCGICCRVCRNFRNNPLCFKLYNETDFQNSGFQLCFRQFSSNALRFGYHCIFLAFEELATSKFDVCCFRLSTGVFDGFCQLRYSFLASLFESLHLPGEDQSSNSTQSLPSSCDSRLLCFPEINETISSLNYLKTPRKHFAPTKSS